MKIVLMTMIIGVGAINAIYAAAGWTHAWPTKTPVQYIDVRPAANGTDAVVIIRLKDITTETFGFVFSNTPISKALYALLLSVKNDGTEVCLYKTGNTVPGTGFIEIDKIETQK